MDRLVEMLAYMEFWNELQALRRDLLERDPSLAGAIALVERPKKTVGELMATDAEFLRARCITSSIQ